MPPAIGGGGGQRNCLGFVRTLVVAPSPTFGCLFWNTPPQLLGVFMEQHPTSGCWLPKREKGHQLQGDADLLVFLQC